MATIERRPVQYKLDETENAATISDSSGDALVNKSSHGLSDGDVVYLITEAESYNGFKFVDVISSSTFKIRNTENGSNITFYKTTDATYYDTVLEHGWQSVHQPIVYQISNDKYPTNESYVQATITDVEDENGYVKITCSGNIDSDLVDLDFIKISNFDVYQVKDAVSDSIAVLELAYDSTYDDMVGETVQFYYNNFHIVVTVYAGLNGTHPYAFVKPYELLATLRLIPDEDNLVTVDISEILKAKVTGKNNLLLDTLPLNLEAFTQFYIGYEEQYDISDGTEITVNSASETADDFEGYAIDSVMPFKSRNISSMSEYVASETIPGAFLTLFNRPLFITGYFYDLSFIKNTNGDFNININGNILPQADKGIGVYRIPITESMLYSEDELCISITAVQDVTEDMDIEDLSTWLSSSISGPLINWTTGAVPTVTLAGAGFPGVQSEWLYLVFSFVVGDQYSISLTFNRVINSGAFNPRTATLAILDNTFAIVESDTLAAVVGGGTDTIELSFIAVSGMDRIGFRHSDGSNVTITVLSVSGTHISAGVGETEIIEELCIDIMDAPCIIDIGTEDFVSGSGSGGCDCPDGILLE